MAKIWRLTKNIEKWQIEADYSSKYAAIFIINIGKY